MMNKLSTLFWWQEQPYPQYSGIDLGNGHSLSAEEVLEGHFHRLSVPVDPLMEPSDIVGSDMGIHNDELGAEISKSANLGPAITRLAPGLTPLTDLAEELEETVPHVQPEPKFRHDLHKALELAHRQQAAQRTLGTYAASPQEGSMGWRLFAFLLIGLGVVSFIGLRFHLGKKRSK